MKTTALPTMLILGIALAACSSDDKDDPGAKYSAIANQVAHPTGTLDKDNAPDIATEYEKISSASAGGLRQQATSSQTQSIACSDGGSYSVTAQSDGSSSGSATLSYDHCCESGCCFDGGGTWYYAADAAQVYSVCGSYKLTLACSYDSSSTTDPTTLSESADYEGCLSSSGGWAYVITVGGKTFTVTGSIYDGSGTLSVTAANGSFTCTYTNYSGSCSGSSGSFSF